MNNELEKTEHNVIEEDNSHSTTLAIGMVLGNKYEIRREIARGGMGIVYEAYHKIFQIRVAIKIIYSDKIDSLQLRRFQKEVLACVNLSHPNVIKIYDARIYNNNPYIVMEYIDGVNICEYVAQHDKNYRKQKVQDTELGIQRDWKLCAKLIYETALALEYIHKQNMLHRDIKPSNILVRSDGSPIIIDLGIVKFQSENNATLTRTGEVLGTLQYMPIEQAQGQHHGVDERSDIYSLGLVLYELLTGEMAYSGKNPMEICYKIMSYYPPLPREINPQIPEALEEITIHAIEKKKENRYATAQEFADALKTYLYDENAQPLSKSEDALKTYLYDNNAQSTPKNNDSKKQVRLQWNKKRIIKWFVALLVLLVLIIIIPPAFKAKKRNIIFELTGNYKIGEKLTPDEITVDGNVYQGIEVYAPGKHNIEIKKAGYKTITFTHDLLPGNAPETITKVMEAKKCNIIFELTGNYKIGEKLTPDEITVDGNVYQGIEVYAPGKHNIEIKKAGYKAITFTHDLLLGDAPETITKVMEAKERECNIVLNNRFTKKTMSAQDVDAAEIGGRSVLDGPYAPGTYDVFVSHPGYYDVRSKVEIVPGEGVQEMKYNLTPKKRIILPKVTYDCTPLPNSPEPQIHIISLETYADTIIHRGDEIAPDTYRVRVEKEGYETTELERVTIYPDDRPFNLSIDMIASMVEILIEISYDIEPPAALTPYTVTFVDKKTGIGRNVTHGKRMKPGSYYLQVGEPGYEFPGGQKEIEVLPGIKPCQISEKLFAKPRQLSFDMMSGSILIKAIEVLLDGQQAKAEDLFKPGQEHQFTAKFEEYQTVTKTIVIPAGEGPYVVDVQLVRLNKFEFRIAKQYYSTEFGMIIDGLRYDLEVFVDNKEVEKHHIMREGGFSMIYGYYYALNSIKNLRILCGYYYDDSLATLTKPAIFKDLSKIDSARLMAHLREVAKINPATALKRMETIMNDPLDKQKISQLPVEEREKMRDTLRDLELRDKKQQEKRNEILKKLGF